MTCQPFTKADSLVDRYGTESPDKHEPVVLAISRFPGRSVPCNIDQGALDEAAWARMCDPRSCQNYTACTSNLKVYLLQSEKSHAFGIYHGHDAPSRTAIAIQSVRKAASRQLETVTIIPQACDQAQLCDRTIEEYRDESHPMSATKKP